MQVLNNKTLFFLTFLAIIIYCSLDFYLNAPNQFEQLKYDWENLHETKHLGSVKIDSISYDFLEIEYSEGHLIDQLDSNNTYVLKNNLHPGYYFRYSDTLLDEDKVSFVGLFWINKMPEVNSSETIFLKQVSLPLQQRGNITVCMIGDSQLIYRGGQQLRKFMAGRNEKLKFIGSNMDLYGYPHNAKLLNNSEVILRNVEHIPKADFYILFFGLHENGSIAETHKSTLRIVKTLLNNGKLILVNIPAVTNKAKKEYSHLFNRHLASLAEEERIVSIDIFTQTQGKNNLFENDGLHLNKDGHKLLAGMILKELESIE